MKHIIKTLCLLVSFSFFSCNSNQSLQEYYVENSENPNFLIIDLPTSVLKLDNVDLSEEQRDALESLRKMNLLAFKKTEENEGEYATESAKVKEILKNDKFVQLMRINTEYGQGVVKYLGEEDAIDEVVIYGNSADQGFAVARILGDNMNPAYMVQLLRAIEKSDYKGEGLDKIAEFLK